MNNKCNNCAKFLTCNRKKCEKISFVEAGMIEKPKRSEKFEIHSKCKFSEKTV